VTTVKHSADVEAPSGPARRRRSPVKIVMTVCGVAVVGGAATWAAIGFGGGDGTSASAAPTAPPATAKIEKRTLTRTETVSGNLGFGDAHSVNLAGTGTITWVPSDGATIKRGKTVYSVDAVKVPLFYGTTPLYRTLSSGSEGKDVLMLEKNLSALGYDGFTVDDEYTSGTADAVEQWQDDLGLDETGTVTTRDVLVAPSAIRVGEVKLDVGDAATGTVLTWTGTTRKVTLDLKVEYEDLVAKGTKATVKLPNDKTVQATVTSVGTSATAEASQSANGTSTTEVDESTLPVELAIKDQKGLGRYQAAPVDVALAAESRKDVLAVPVTALVALREGGYAVEVVSGGTSSYVKVETGMFASGMVEVKGTGLTEGLIVGVPK
jgi:hypothetical protein